MKTYRRSLLSGMAVIGVAGLSGCIGDTTMGGNGDEESNDDDNSAENDPFPEETDDARRGRDNALEYVTGDDDPGYEDGSMECASALQEAVYNHLKGRKDADFGVGAGNRPEGYDGIALTVWRSGVEYELDDEVFDELRSITPSTAYLKSGDDDRICASPVYVTEPKDVVDD